MQNNCGKQSKIPLLWVVQNQKCLLRHLHTIYATYRLHIQPDCTIFRHDSGTLEHSVMMTMTNDCGLIPYWTIHCRKLLAFVSSNKQKVHYLTIAQPRENHNCGIYYLYSSCIHSMQNSCTPYFTRCITHVIIIAVHVWLLCIHGYTGPLWSVWCTCPVGNDATWLPCAC